MALTNVELYEALKPSVGEDAARLIAEVLPGAEELATRHDLLTTKSELQLSFARLEGMIERSSKETMRWMLTFFVPLWIATWGTLLAVLLKR